MITNCYMDCIYQIFIAEVEVTIFGIKNLNRVYVSLLVFMPALNFEEALKLIIVYISEAKMCIVRTGLEGVTIWRFIALCS